MAIKLLVWVALYAVVYLLTLQYLTVCEAGGRLREPTSLKTPLDAWTPVNIYIMWFYIACLSYVPFAGLLFAVNPRISAASVAAFYVSIAAVYLISYASYLVFPTTASEVMLTSYGPNKEHFINRGMFEHLQDMYTVSTPLGDFPSLHVSPLMVMSLFLWRRWRTLLWIFAPLAFLGAVGTFVLKFHTVVGFLGGAALGVVVYKYLFLPLLGVLEQKFHQAEPSLVS